MNAYATADTIADDWLSRREGGRGGKDAVKDKKEEEKEEDEVVLNPTPHPDDPPVEIQDAIREGRVVEYDTWRAIDEEEVRRGGALKKERERMGWDSAHSFIKSRCTQ